MKKKGGVAMAIVIVDDTTFSLEVTKAFLNAAGYMDVFMVQSAKKLFRLIDGDPELGFVDIDLILMDIVMPDIDGIVACQQVKERPGMIDVPIIMLTASMEKDDLQLAFSAGAMDYIKKPLDKVELLARVRSALKLKHEIVRRKARESELLEATRQLQIANERLKDLSFSDGLTDLPNRRHFNQTIWEEFQRSEREKTPLSFIILDIDYFKLFNDAYGHLKGDDCLKLVASTLQETLNRPGDFIARYGGEEFAVILPNTNDSGAFNIAEIMRASVEEMKIAHISSSISEYVTVSVGVATRCPEQKSSLEELILVADKALYCSKQEGRNRVSVERLGCSDVLIAN